MAKKVEKASSVKSAAKVSGAVTKVATDDQIRRLAYEKWQAAGCPGGDGREYWIAAEKELNGK